MAVYLSQRSVAKWADRKTWDEARTIYRTQGVRDLYMNGNRVTATIMSAGRPVYTRLDIAEDQSVISNCPCYQNQKYDRICSHVVAAGLAVAALTEDPLRELKQRIDERIQHDAQQGHLPQPRRNRATAAPPSSTLRLRIPQSWQQDLQQGSLRIAIRIDVNGKRHVPERIAKDRLLTFTDEDIYCLYVLEAFADQPICPSSIDLNDQQFSQLLQIARGQPIWIEGTHEPLHISQDGALGMLTVAFDEITGELLIEHATEPPGEVFLISKRNAWMRQDNQLRLLESALPVELQEAYHRPLRVPRTELVRCLNETIPALEDRFIIDHSADRKRLRFTPGNPTFRVTIKGHSDHASVSLEARYGNCYFDTSAPPSIYDVIPVEDQPFHYLTRNEALEQENRKCFTAAFDTPVANDGCIYLTDANRVIQAMRDIADGFKRQGWTIQFGDALANLANDTCWIIPWIVIRQIDQETYQLETKYTDQASTAVNTEMVEMALQNNQSMIQDAGRTLLIDATRLNHLTAALAECIQYREGKALVSRIHAAFIDAVIADFPGARCEAPESWMTHAKAQESKQGLSKAPIDEHLRQQLRPYQREGINWLCFLDQSGYSGILADEMGLGKTVQALAWVRVKRNASREAGYPPQPAIVVCPTSLIHNWAREVQRFTPDLSCLVISGAARNRHDKNPGDYDLIITSYALLRRDVGHYLNIHFNAIILDEAQHIKNRTTQNALAAKRLKGDRRLVLTGTPIENSVNDLWSIMDFLMPGYLGTHTSFRIRFEQPISQQTPNSERVLSRLRMKMDPFMLRRLKIDVASDLPDKFTQIADCQMLPAQRRLYNRLLAQYHESIHSLVDEQGFDRARFSVFSSLLRLRQCCCHPALLKRTPGADEVESGKMDLFFELLDEAMDGGHRVLVFSQFVQMLHILRGALTKRQIPYAYLDGSTRNRMEQVDAFNNNPNIPVFLVSLKAGGSGLNLTGANVVIHYDPWWNPAVEDQATDRAHRIGQSRTVYSIKLVTENSIEQKVIQLQHRKRTLINATFGTGTSLEQSLTWDDVCELLRPC